MYGNFDVFGVDWGTPMAMAKEKLGDKYVLQGNMEPCRLYSKEETTKCVEAIQKVMGKKRHIFNLGHGILPDIKRACEIIAEGYTGKSDVGLATKDDGTKRYFLGVGSEGFDSEVARRANENKEKNYNSLVLKVFFGWKNKKVRVIMDNNTYEGEAILIAVGNGGSYGGGMYICQKAKVDDGLFNITIANVKKLKLLFQFKKTYSGSLLPYPNIYEYQSRKVRIEMLNPDDDAYLCQVDGEMLGNLPVTYETIKNGCEFIQPQINEFAEVFKEKYGHYYWDYDH